jgi:four helix bundle protein
VPTLEKAVMLKVLLIFNKLNVALKEADETQFWLELLFRTQFINESEYTLINNDIDEIISILTASIKTNKKKINNNQN